jgi:uncharacterized protein (DUF697 family)
VTRLPIAPRDVLALSRHVRSSEAMRGPLLVTGVLAEQLARELGAGADSSAVRTTGKPEQSAALVHVVAGEATPDDERVLRAATRALVPLVVVQLGDASARLPYVLPTDMVRCEPGKGFPIDEIAKTLARTLGTDGAGLARSLPALRDAYQEQRAEESAISAAAVAVAGGDLPKLPVLALAQARALSDIATARGDDRGEGPKAAASTVASPLGAALGTGLVARALVRRLPVRNRAVEAVVAAATTYALATAFRRFTRR